MRSVRSLIVVALVSLASAGIATVCSKGRLHGVAQSCQRHLSLGRVGVASAVATENLLMGIEEERGPGQVVVEVEAVEIDAPHVQDARQDELARQVGDLGIKTNNLFVESFAVLSPFAAEDQEDRLASLPRGLPGGRDILQPSRCIGRLGGETRGREEPHKQGGTERGERAHRMAPDFGFSFGMGGKRRACVDRLVRDGSA